MKLQDAVELILMRKGTVIHSVPPDITVYEALEKMAESNIGALGDRVCLRKNAIQWQIVETMYVQDAQVKNIPVECAHDEGHWLWVWG